jgi:hypothetical protein
MAQSKDTKRDTKDMAINLQIIFTIKVIGRNETPQCIARGTLVMTSGK